MLQCLISFEYYSLGLVILLTKPFKRNDIITVANYKGKIISIDVKYLKLKSLKERNVYHILPLKLVYDSAMTIESSYIG
jgi:small-conductance mechanosensitive channel